MMVIQFRLLSRLTLFGFSLIVLLLATGCDQLKSLTGSEGQTAVATIGIYGIPHMIAPGGSSTITVIVLDTHDKPYAGATVTLTTTLGTLDQTSGQTDGSGTFVTALRTSLTDRGSAIMRAEAGGLWCETTAVIVD